MINSLGALHRASKARETKKKKTFPAQVYSLETWPVSDSTSNPAYCDFKMVRGLPVKQKSRVLKGDKEMEASSFTITHHQVTKGALFIVLPAGG